MKHILIIQTAFIGDVILATSLVESIQHATQGGVKIDVLVRKGNEGLLADHPYIQKVWVWDKKGGKYRQLLKLSKELRTIDYDRVYNLQRFASTGFLSWRIKAKQKIGFKKNPFSFAYDRKVVHVMGNNRHEIERNFDLIQVDFPSLKEPMKPRLYPSLADQEKVGEMVVNTSFFVMAPSSVWFTKQLPKEKWVELIQRIPAGQSIYLIGAPSDRAYLDEIRAQSAHPQVKNVAGELTLLQSAELIRRAKRSFVNDSAPLHLASAVNAPVTAFFCSTVPEFGFGPLSSDATVIEYQKTLTCRPCGLHGHATCPEGHFKCGKDLVLPIVD